MTLFSRPVLDDFQFRQPEGTSLSLSGLTRVRSWSGLTLSDGIGGDITVTASGASTGTTGYVMTYMDGSISLQPSSVSGITTVFDTHRATTRDGIPAVTVSGACTINNFLETYFFPAVDPTISLCVATGGNDREFGDVSVGNLCYSAVRETNQLCSLSIDTDANGSYDCNIITTPVTGSCNGTVPYTYPTISCACPATGTSNTSVSFLACVRDTSNALNTGDTTITWRNKRFTLKSETLYNDNSIGVALSGGELSTSIVKSISNESFSNQFFYYIFPTSFGTPSFTVNGLPNNSWGTSTAGTLFTIDYTNVNGYTNRYYVARSDSKITGTYNIVIS